MSGNTKVLEAKTMRVETAVRRRANPAPTSETKRVKESGEAKRKLQAIGAKTFSDTKSVPGVSIFAIVGTLFVSVLMVFVVLAQIRYNEAASESVKASAELRALTERHRVLEMAFETSFDIREVERIAITELGMSRPDSTQIITIPTVSRDTALVIVGESEQEPQGFLEFLSSLVDYFR